MKIKNKNLIKSVSFRSNIEKILFNGLLSSKKIYETCQTNLKTNQEWKNNENRNLF
jgi:hypothetical protein